MSDPPPVVRLIEAFRAQWPDPPITEPCEWHLIHGLYEVDSARIRSVQRLARETKKRSVTMVALERFLQVLLDIPEAERLRQVEEWTGGERTLDEEPKAGKSRVVWSGSEFDSAVGE